MAEKTKVKFPEQDNHDFFGVWIEDDSVPLKSTFVRFDETGIVIGSNKLPGGPRLVVYRDGNIQYRSQSGEYDTVSSTKMNAFLLNFLNSFEACFSS